MAPTYQGHHGVGLAKLFIPTHTVGLTASHFLTFTSALHTASPIVQGRDAAGFMSVQTVTGGSWLSF